MALQHITQLNPKPNGLELRRIAGNITSKEMFRGCFRHGWKVSAFSCFYFGVESFMKYWRDQNDAWNTLAAGTATGTAFSGLFRKQASLTKAILFGSLFGASLSGLLAISQSVFIFPYTISERENKTIHDSSTNDVNVSDLLKAALEKQLDEVNDAENQAKIELDRQKQSLINRYGPKIANSVQQRSKVTQTEQDFQQEQKEQQK